ncbi:LysR family transcriptional regulator [Pseudomonas daroniae]|uniref:LysR family transcriptional regulator n=1 Tax=Phytopseudomonas daroniae TaxID=2487519 RepID=A0A4V2KAG5_9GAMM|nr:MULTISPECIES: LysR family transcriptional regulator [Pseudomonas]TBU75098.1 LysR family transcriptional regulator [Pseudomonas daroniae]TBU80470.1 LysR family transcriptional regulator [Pseudomonas sp. FRB 228]TBU89197.1 LysR family transcriptional regulator [Pseudomonas daroniae]
MRLRHIEIFQAILQTGSITGAANLLNISQPAATKALQHAEAQLGFALFNRVRGQLLVTAEARILEQSTARVFDELQRVRRLAGNLRAHGVQALRIVATPSLAQSLLPKVIPAWCALYPQSPCELATHHTPELVESLLLHEADLALTLQNPKHPGLRMQVLAQARMVVIAPPGYWPTETLREPLPIEALSGQPLLALDTRDALGGLLEQHLSEASSAPTIVARAQTWQLARALVAEGMGLAVVDPLTGYGSGAGVQVRPLRPVLPVNLYAMTRLDEGGSDAMQRLLQMLGEQAQRIMLPG